LHPKSKKITQFVLKMKDTPFQVFVNEREQAVTSAQAHDLDLLQNGLNQFHILKNQKAYHAELLSVDYNSKAFTFKINGNIHTATIGDRYDRLVKSMGLSKAGATKINEIKAPMPGLVLEVSVEVGQTVQKGDKILILEAMKMENVLKAAGDGVVKAIRVAKGTPVEKGFVLIEME
jgi:biotin carboxyl carrier protein